MMIADVMCEHGASGETAARFAVWSVRRLIHAGGRGGPSSGVLSLQKLIRCSETDVTEKP